MANGDVASRPADANRDALELEALGLRGRRPRRRALIPRRAGAILRVLAVFAFVVGIRMIALDQPIVENYAGRQIPTAMVARNLERGSGFFRPQLDTGPFPNYFVVEAPIYQIVLLGMRRVTGLPIDQAGRATSALATGIAALALYMLVQRRKDVQTAMISAVVFGLLPIALRYGRAVQPDMLALALVLLGSACWDRWASGMRWPWAVLGWALLTLGFASKVLLVFSMVPLGLLVANRMKQLGNGFNDAGRFALILFLISPLVLASQWYWAASNLVRHGSIATRISAEAWLHSLWPPRLFEAETWVWIIRFGVIRAFTPIGGLLMIKCFYERVIDRFWVAWCASGLATLLLVSGKLHHEYYWLMLAPSIAVGAAIQIVRFHEAATLEGRKPREAHILFGLQAGLSLALAWPTWSTPPAWGNLKVAASRIETLVPETERLVAREALLYYADRRGMRLEAEPAAIQRALAEWSLSVGLNQATPETLLIVYHDRGAGFLAETGDPRGSVLVTPLAHAAERLASSVLIAEPEFLLVKLRALRPEEPR